MGACDCVHTEANCPNADTRPRWRHVKRGTVYVEIGRGKFQISKRPGGYPVTSDFGEVLGALDYEPVVIYQSVDDQQVWVRLVSEFEDGRFERERRP